MSVQDAAADGGSGLLEPTAVETDLIGRLLAEFDDGAWRRWLGSQGLRCWPRPSARTWACWFGASPTSG